MRRQTRSGLQKDLIFVLPQTGVNVPQEYRIFLHTTTRTAYYLPLPIMGVVTADTLIEKAERTASAAERIGMDDVAAAMRDDARLFKELKDGFRRLGEDI